MKSMFTSLTIRAMAIARIVFRSNEFVRLPPNDVSLAKGWSNGPKGEHATQWYSLRGQTCFRFAESRKFPIEYAVTLGGTELTALSFPQKGIS